MSPKKISKNLQIILYVKPVTINAVNKVNITNIY